MILQTFLPLLLCLLIVRLPAPPLYHHSLPPGPVSCVRLRTVPYKNAAGYIQHLSSRHHGEGPFTLRISGSLNSVLMLKASRHIESARTRNLRFSGLPANPPLSQLQTPPLRRGVAEARLRRFSTRTGPGSGHTRCQIAQYRSRARPFGGGLLTTPDRTPPP